MSRALLALGLVAAVALGPACPSPVADGGADAGGAAVETLRTSGVVRSARCQPLAGVRAEPQLAVVEVVVGDGPAGDRPAAATRLTFHADGPEGVAARPTRLAGPDERLTLPPGRYVVAVEHSAGPAARGEGRVLDLVLPTDSARRLTLELALPTATLAVRLENGGKPAGPLARYRVVRLPAAGAADGDAPVVTQNGDSGEHVLPLGRYRVEGEASWSEAARATAAEEVTLTEADAARSVTLEFGRRLGRLRPSATDAGSPADEGTAFLVYRPGVDPAAPGEPLATAWGGETVTLPAGTYAVAARHVDGPLLRVVRWQTGVTVRPDAVADVTVDLGLLAGSLRFRLLRDGRPATGAVELRLSAAGAPAGAEPLGAVAGSGPVRLPAGRYDVQVRLAPDLPGGTPEVRRERGVVVEAGAETVIEIRL